MHYVKYKKWWDTKTFGQAGKLFTESGEKSYCPFPKSSQSYYEYWTEQQYYIENGFFHDGQRVAGLHYLYQNFCPIHDKKKKRMAFPDFWALDADYFLKLERALGLGVWKDKEPFRPPLFEVSKTRQSGFSLKGMVPILYNIEFVPHSVNYLGAWLSKDCIKTLKVFQHYFDFNFKFCEFGKRWVEWKKEEQYITGYVEKIDGQDIKSGFQSELNLVSFKDNATKGVGGPCTLFVIEEAGMHPQLISSIQYIIPACKDGDYTTGNILAYGAAGEEVQSDDLKRLHYNIKRYHGWPFVNGWDNDPLKPESGYFVPDYSCRKGHMDKDGNPNQVTAMVQRDIDIADLKEDDYESYLRELSQHPQTAKEMFSNRALRRFDQSLLEAQLVLVETLKPGTGVMLSEGVEGDIKWRYRTQNDPEPITEWQLSTKQNKTGCVMIYDWPEAGEVYFGAIDSYNQDQSATTTSLGQMYIANRKTRTIVAEFVGRPASKYELYRIFSMLQRLFNNAVAMPENEDIELTPWYYNNKLDHLLADQPDIIRQIIPGSQAKRTKGIHADERLVIAAENKIARYISEVLGDYYSDDEKEKVGVRYGVSRLLPRRLLQELLYYFHDSWKNFDGVRTLGWLLMYEDEIAGKDIEQYTEGDSSFLIGKAAANKIKNGLRYDRELSN
jgi:hypothetical protein